MSKKTEEIFALEKDLILKNDAIDRAKGRHNLRAAWYDHFTLVLLTRHRFVELTLSDFSLGPFSGMSPSP